MTSIDLDKFVPCDQTASGRRGSIHSGFGNAPELCIDIRHSASKAWPCLLVLLVVAALVTYLLLSPIEGGVLLAAMFGPFLTFIVLFVFVRNLMRSSQQLEIREHGITRLRKGQPTTWLYENIQRFQVVRAESDLTSHYRFTIEGSDSGRLRFREEFVKDWNHIARCEFIAQAVADRVVESWVKRLVDGQRIPLTPSIAITADAIEVSGQRILFTDILLEGTLVGREGKRILLRTDTGVVKMLWPVKTLAGRSGKRLLLRTDTGVVKLLWPSDWNYELLLAALRRLTPHRSRIDESQSMVMTGTKFESLPKF